MVQACHCASMSLCKHVIIQPCHNSSMSLFKHVIKIRLIQVFCNKSSSLCKYFVLQVHYARVSSYKFFIKQVFHYTSSPLQLSFFFHFIFFLHYDFIIESTLLRAIGLVLDVLELVSVFIRCYVCPSIRPSIRPTIRWSVFWSVCLCHVSQNRRNEPWQFLNMT